MRRKWTEEQLVVAVREADSITDVTRRLGISVGSGGAFANIRPYIERLGLDTSHWDVDLRRTEKTKICSDCKLPKSYDEYFRATSSIDGYHNYCKECKRKKQRVWGWAKTHGLTPEEYEIKLEQQNHRCAICKEEANGGRWPRLYVDHCHETNRVRGLLCAACNLGLGKFKDDPARLDEAAVYLRDR